MRAACWSKDSCVTPQKLGEASFAFVEGWNEQPGQFFEADKGMTDVRAKSIFNYIVYLINGCEYVARGFHRLECLCFLLVVIIMCSCFFVVIMSVEGRRDGILIITTSRCRFLGLCA